MLYFGCERNFAHFIYFFAIYACKNNSNKEKIKISPYVYVEIVSFLKIGTVKVISVEVIPLCLTF